MELLRVILETLFPSRCIACRADLAGTSFSARPGFCAGCRDTLLSGLDACCPLCGLVWVDAPPGDTHVCGACQIDPPPWVEARAAFAYGGALQEAIARWKNPPAGASSEALGPPLAALMTAAATRAGWDRLAEDALVVPVPATREGLGRRGFNTAGVLARRIGRHIGRDFDPLALGIRRAPQRSAGLGRQARRRRMRGVFAADSRRVAGRTILLVDDVMTTGATVRAATSALLRAGARGVRVAVLARVPGHG